MIAREYINKTREYLDYIEEHLNFVDTAHKRVRASCKHLRVFTDPEFSARLEAEIKAHDLSKLSQGELVPYRIEYFGAQNEPKSPSYVVAWERHKNNNPHHWENWTTKVSHNFHPDEWEIDCMHMIIDWTAMGYKFGDTAQEYYENHKDFIKIPKEYRWFMYEIFEAIRLG